MAKKEKATHILGKRKSEILNMPHAACGFSDSRKVRRSQQARDRLIRNRNVLFELLLVLAITYCLMYFLRDSAAKGLIIFLPVAYALLELRFRHRSWKELGIIRHGFVRGIITNWHLFVIVALVLQVLIPWISSLLWPDYLHHILDRLPWSPGAGLAALFSFLVLAAFSTFIEELVFRGLTQERLGWFIPQGGAIVVASVLFGIAHWAPSNPLVVLADISGVVLDGIFYGLIYARSKSIVVSWVAHFLADVVGLSILLMMIGF
jgi:membrane protease YdiL (CAAX protease family)